MNNSIAACSPRSRRKPLARSLVRKTALAATLAALGSITAWALPFVDPLVQISDISPFGPLESCGSFPGARPGTNALDSEVEPYIDVNPTNPDNIVAFWQQDRWSNGGARGNVAGVSLDGGSTWQIVVVPGLTDCSGGDFERATDPWISFGPDGILHQMSLLVDTPLPDRPGSPSRSAMAASKSENGGLNWSDPILLIDDADPSFFNDKNTLTADPTDSRFVYAAWRRLEIPEGAVINPLLVPRGGQKSPFYFARSTDGGDSWEPARKIYEPGAGNENVNHQIVVLPDGTLVAFFDEILENRNDGGDERGINISLLRSTDKGETWLPHGPADRVLEIFNDPNVATVTPDEGTPVRGGSILFDLAVNASTGEIYVVWQDTRFSGIQEVAFMMSSDGGDTWSEPIKINQTPANADNPLRAQVFAPAIAAAPDGTVAVTYYDFRNDDDTGELADYFAIFCEMDCSEPANWGDEVMLTDVSFDFLLAPSTASARGGLFLGDYMGLASDGTGFLPGFAIAVDETDPASIFSRRFGQIAP